MNRKSALGCALIIVAMGLGAVIFQCSRVGNVLNTVGGWFISDSQEVALGAEFYQEIMQSDETPPALDTTGSEGRALNNYIQSIGRTIVNNLDSDSRPENEHLTYRFTVLDDDTTVNAFAIPGGYICIYTGLIKTAENEDEIAGVLAHEVGHITQQHYIDALGLQYVKKLVFGDDANVIVDLAAAMGSLKMSRDNEYEADSCGVEYLAQSGYNPSGMKTFLQKLAQSGSSAFELFSTHPATDKRVANADRLVDDTPASVRDRALTPKDVPGRWQ
jgi:predicted Zn-dependent protease